ncbi:MAG: acyl-CoA carboxylase subunit beta [Clostridia bacterium]|nr:acyl-CoA carboxylase subunit beta [Clostridia bacterium]
MWDKQYEDRLIERETKMLLGGGAKRIEKQHAASKLTARERIEILFDKGTFIEVNGFVESRIDDFNMDEKRVPGDGVVTGYGKINGRLAFASSEDFTVIGGTLGEYHSVKICEIMDMALKMRAPYISINDSGGARIEEGVSSLSGYSGIFLRNTLASGVIPQISVILGPCAGGACYSPAICDFVFMTRKTSKMFITGPNVVKSVIGTDISAEELGGADVHSSVSGVSHFTYDNEKECLIGVRDLLGYLPQSCDSKPQKIEGTPIDESKLLTEIIPDNQKKAYDVKKVIDTFVDKDSFFEVQKDFAKNIVVGFSRIDGETVGIVANQPNYMGGAIDINSSDKAARFVRTCDCFNIPIVTLVDVTGFLPGVNQEHAGIIRHGAKLLFAYSEATVPKISLILRKAYGGAYIAMNSKNMGADMVFALPIAQIAVMGAEGAVEIIYRKDIEKSDNPEQQRSDFIKKYEEKFMNPYLAAERGYINTIIHPETVRENIAQSLKMLKNKSVDRANNKKHGNIPL